MKISQRMVFGLLKVKTEIREEELTNILKLDSKIYREDSTYLLKKYKI